MKETGRKENGRRVEPDMDVLQTARAVIRMEAEAIARLEERLGEDFSRAVRAMVECAEGGGKIWTPGDK